MRKSNSEVWLIGFLSHGYGTFMKAVLGLEDGTFVKGEGFGVEGERSGELVFTTQMTGYMESLTDPSYHGQILMFTFPQIGNYGVDQINFQNNRIWAEGCVIREACQRPENNKQFTSFFERAGLSGISGVDTRRLTIITREEGTLRACLLTGDDNEEYAIFKARKEPSIVDKTLIPDVSVKQPHHIPGPGKKIAVLDLGIKKNMIISLQKRGADITLYPYNTKKDEILSSRPDALFISNGPGDPACVTETISTVKDIIGEIPVFGICMGNQICSLALGGSTYKMKFGHRGANQPVRHLNKKVSITSQNHGFVVDEQSLPQGCQVSYVNMNDGTLEGFDDDYLDIHCVQFHPEAHSGPHDTEKTFFDDMFRRLT